MTEGEAREAHRHIVIGILRAVGDSVESMRAGLAAGTVDATYALDNLIRQLMHVQTTTRTTMRDMTDGQWTG